MLTQDGTTKLQCRENARVYSTMFIEELLEINGNKEKRLQLCTHQYEKKQYPAMPMLSYNNRLEV
jgi:hypothetical protein